MYKVHLMTSGNVMTAARHELVKGLPGEHFQDLFDAFQVTPPQVHSQKRNLIQIQIMKCLEVHFHAL